MKKTDLEKLKDMEISRLQQNIMSAICDGNLAINKHQNDLPLKLDLIGDRNKLESDLNDVSNEINERFKRLVTTK